MTERQFPRAFIKREQALLGNQWPEFEAAHQRPSPISIRMNPGKSSVKIEALPVPWATHGMYLAQRPSFTLDPHFHGGKYYVQEASSMFLEQAFCQNTDPAHSLTVLDLCAAPGGKSTHLLSLMGNDSLLVSNEVIQSRAGILSENVQKWGHTNVIITNNDAKDFQRLPGFFDLIIIDAPCSGEGLFRKDPTTLQEWSEGAVALCSRRQRRILNDVWPSLKSGGLLIYSTCTYSTDENEENLQWLKQEFLVESVPVKIKSEWGVHTVENDSMTGYRFFPHRVKGEGFFLAVMRKLTPQAELRVHSKTKLSHPVKKISDEMLQWLVNPDKMGLILHSERVQLFPQKKMPELQAIVNNLRVVLAGTPIATIKHNKLIPEHSFALSLNLNRDAFPSIPLTLDLALDYLRKDVLNFKPAYKGFALITFEDVALGWVNVLENRINNLYPSEWRIRMK